MSHCIRCLNACLQRPQVVPHRAEFAESLRSFMFAESLRFIFTLQGKTS